MRKGLSNRHDTFRMSCLFSVLFSLCCKTKYKSFRQSYIFKVWLKYLCTLEATPGPTEHHHSHRGATLQPLLQNILPWFIYLTFISPSQTDKPIYSTMSPCTNWNNFMYQNTRTPLWRLVLLSWENHKRNKSAAFTLQRIELNTKLKGKDIKCTLEKPVVHGSETQGNKWYTEIENSQRSYIFRLPPKKSYIC